MKNLYKQFGYLFQTIRGSELTFYVGIYKGCLSNQNISSEKSEELDLLAILEHTKVVWAIRTFFLRNWRHWTHSLYWNRWRLFEQSEHPLWGIRERHWSHKLCFEHAKVFEQSEYSLWEKIRLTSYVAVWKDCLIDQNIPFEKLVDLDSPTMFKYVGTCKGCLTD